MKKVQFLIKVFFSHINVYGLTTTKYWLNYSEAVKENIICANNLMFSNRHKMY